MWRYDLRTVAGQTLTKIFIGDARDLRIISPDVAAHLHNILRQIDLSAMPDSSFVAVLEMACEGIEANIKDALEEAQAHAELSLNDKKIAAEALSVAITAEQEAEEVLLSAFSRIEALGNLILTE